MKPRIGISGYPRTVDTVLGPTLVHSATRFYVDSVARAGGVPIVLPVLVADDVCVAIADDWFREQNPRVLIVGRTD